jgi:hypothetical protein
VALVDSVDGRYDEREMKTVVQAVVGTMIAVLWPGVMFGQGIPNEPIRTSLCELVKTPDQFSGGMVQFRAEFVSKFQWEGFVDGSCSAKLQLGGSHPLDDLKPEQGQYAFTTPGDDNDHPERLNWKPIPAVLPVILNQDDNYRAFRKYAETKFRWLDGGVCLDCPLYRITVTATGRFDHFQTDIVAVRANAATKAGQISYLDAPLFRLVLQSVSNVSAVAIDASVYSEGKRRDLSAEEAHDLLKAFLKIPGSALLPYSSPDQPDFYSFEAIFGASKGPVGVLNVDYYAVDRKTGDLWSGLICERFESSSLLMLQRAIRQRIGLTDEEYKKTSKLGPLCVPGQTPQVARGKQNRS